MALTIAKKDTNRPAVCDLVLSLRGDQLILRGPSLNGPMREMVVKMLKKALEAVGDGEGKHEFRMQIGGQNRLAELFHAGKRKV